MSSQEPKTDGLRASCSTSQFDVDANRGLPSGSRYHGYSGCRQNAACQIIELPTIDGRIFIFARPDAFKARVDSYCFFWRVLSEHAGRPPCFRRDKLKGGRVVAVLVAVQE